MAAWVGVGLLVVLQAASGLAPPAGRLGGLASQWHLRSAPSRRVAVASLGRAPGPVFFPFSTEPTSTTEPLVEAESARHDEEDSGNPPSKTDSTLEMVKRLRLEAEKAELELAKERMTKQLAKARAAMSLVESLLEASGENRTVALRKHARSLNVELFVRLEERLAGTSEEKEAESLRELRSDIWAAVKARDEKLAKELRRDVDKRLGIDTRKQEIRQTSLNSTGGEEQLLYSLVESLMDGNSTKATDALESMNTEGTSPWVDDLFPYFVPLSLIGVLNGPDIPELDREAATILEKEVLTDDVFRISKVDKSAYVWLFRGNVKGDPTEAYQTVLERVNSNPKLKDSVELLYQRFPLEFHQEVEAMEQGIIYSDEDVAMPVFLAIPKGAVPTEGLEASIYSLLSLGIGGFTTLTFVLGAFALNTPVMNKILAEDASSTADLLPLIWAVLGVQAAHEVGHTILALIHDVKLSTPVVIPSLQIGSYGSVTRFLSYPKTRAQMFDIAIAGPVFGFIASFAALIYGLTLTNSSPQEALDVFPALPEAVLSGNVLVDILCRLLCPPLTDLPQASMAFVHPYTVAGLLGLLVNSLNMLPIGTLDGGRALTAVAGRRAASIVGTLALVLLLAVSFIADLPIQMYWVFVVILFQRMLDVPALDEVTEVDGTRTAIFGVVLTLASFCMVSIPLELLSEAAQQLP